MIRNLYEKFTNNAGREMFRVSEKEYDNKLLKQCKKLKESTLNSTSFYNNFFKVFGQTSKQNSKIFSKLKHE